MIEERASVFEVGEGFAWVATHRQTACGSCDASRTCGTAALAKVFGNRRNRLRVLAEIPLQVGDEVIVGIDQRALVRGSLAVYIVPLLLMFLSAGVAEFVADSEGATLLFGAFGLGVGFWRLDAFNRRIRDDSRFHPVVLRRLAV